MTRAICVAGARPNFMKIKPVIEGLEARSAEVLLVHTGQHYDPSLSDVFFADLGLRQPDRLLEVGSGSHAAQTAATMVGFEPLVDEWQPDVVVVVGDVNSTLACAIVAAKSGVHLAHVEAGLRSRDWSMPEEVNRVLTDRASDLLLAPSADAVENLRQEGFRKDQIHLVGNVMIDSLLQARDRAAARPIRADLGIEDMPYGLVTLHRPSNVDDPLAFRGLIDVLDKVAERLPLIFPVHPRTRAALAAAGDFANVRTIDPVGYLDFVRLEEGAALVLTDSGGVQEETTALGVPCLTMRDSTERPVTIDEGTNRLVGTDPSTILAAVTEVLATGVEARCPELWDGHAGDRIAEVLTDPENYRLGRPTTGG